MRSYREHMADYSAHARARGLVRNHRRRRRARRSQRRRGTRRGSGRGWRRRRSEARRRSIFPKLVEQRGGEPRNQGRSAADLPPDPEECAGAEDGLERAVGALSRVAAGPRPRAVRPLSPCDIAVKVVGIGSVGTMLPVGLFIAGGQRPAVPADQGGAAVGARALCRQERLSESRPARGERPAADAVGERHLSGLGRTARTAATSTSANCATRRSPRSSKTWTPICCANTANCAHGRWRRRMPGPATPATIAGYMGSSDAFDEAITRIRRGLRRPSRT